MMTHFRILYLLIFFSACGSLTGCTLADTALPSPILGAAVSGKAYGGQQPVVGAKVYLLAVNPGGYGSASLSLATTALTGNAVDSIGSYTTTDSSGAFTLAGDYDCTQGYALGSNTSGTATNLLGSEQVYLYVLGGNSGTGNNKNIGLLAALGPCNAQFNPLLQVNEVTTVAAAYAFAGYATDATHVSNSGTSLAITGLTNSGLNSANLVNVATGVPVANSTGITRPVAILNTIADILASCVNGVSGNTNCSTLFQYTESNGTSGTIPGDTGTAAINLAHNPWPTSAGMTALFGLAQGTGAPFTGLTTQPNDFTLGLNYTGGGINQPTGIAIDASGNAWTANYGNNSVSKLSSTGTAISPGVGYTGGGVSLSEGIAIDGSSNVWTTNLGNGNNSVSKLSNTGTAISPAAGYTGGGIINPIGIAIDGSGNVWVVSFGNTDRVSKLSNAGTAISPSGGYTGGGLSGNPEGIAIDGSGNAWAADASGNAATELSSTGTPISPSAGYTGGGISRPWSIAIDASGNAWTANGIGSGSSVSKLSSTGTAISPSGGYTGGGLGTPESIAIDGAGNAWTANNNNSSVSKISNAGLALSPGVGYTGGGINVPGGIAIDISGDVWIANNGGSSVTELIGAASPVVTPLVANLISPYSAPASKP